MKNAKIINKSEPSIGVFSRTGIDGEEKKLVYNYIDYIVNKNKRNKEKKMLIFVEPKISSGYPDLVIVEFKDKFLRNLLNREFSLKLNDLKLLFECVTNSGKIIKYFENSLGFNFYEISKSLEHLMLLNLIRVNSNGKLYANKRIIKKSITKIIAIEAKIDKWNEALDQARRNLWFATESYILLNRDSCNEKIINTCESEGVGIILVNGSISTVLKSQSKSFPVSYGSLLFWEWLLRKEVNENDDGKGL